ncbi:DNA-processing protein DprA [Corynebacterium hindlerae]|uniref:DNA-processing protein DprA n=1 Tax=Corynebacterium hindlerae TaxID=699041 RepID=UPI0031B71AD8
MQRNQAWAYLSRCIEGPNRHLQELLGQGRDVEEIAQGVKNREAWVGELLKVTQSRFTVDSAARDLETIDKLGGRLITPEDDEWPRSEFAQAFGFAASGSSEHARSVQDDAVPPHALWVRGQRLDSLVAQSVTVVGTRASSSYGAAATRSLVSGLVSHQWTIVSGGALGIDSVAHQTALEAGGRTVVVASCGLDRHYPAAHTHMFEKITHTGALISEYPPGVTPARHRFLTRNRLAAALSAGTVVVEAAWRSGALNTLTWAEGLGKVTMAVPGPITSMGSLGCHDRIRQGRAQLVVSADEIRQLVSSVGEVDVDGQYEMLFAKNAVQSLSRNEMRVFDALSEKATPAQQVAEAAGLTVALTVHLLVDLVKRGLVVRDGAQFRRAELSE